MDLAPPDNNNFKVGDRVFCFFYVRNWGAVVRYNKSRHPRNCFGEVEAVFSQHLDLLGLPAKNYHKTWCLPANSILIEGIIRAYERKYGV